MQFSSFCIHMKVAAQNLVNWDRFPFHKMFSTVFSWESKHTSLIQLASLCFIWMGHHPGAQTIKLTSGWGSVRERPLIPLMPLMKFFLLLFHRKDQTRTCWASGFSVRWTWPSQKQRNARPNLNRNHTTSEWILQLCIGNTETRSSAKCNFSVSLTQKRGVIGGSALKWCCLERRLFQPRRNLSPAPASHFWPASSSPPQSATSKMPVQPCKQSAFVYPACWPPQCQSRDLIWFAMENGAKSAVFVADFLTEFLWVHKQPNFVFSLKVQQTCEWRWWEPAVQFWCSRGKLSRLTVQEHSIVFLRPIELWELCPCQPAKFGCSFSRPCYIGEQ